MIKERTTQPNIKARKEYLDIVEDTPTVVRIPRTRKKVRLTGIKCGTMQYLTKLWVERDLAAVKVEEGSEVLKDLAVAPLFSVKEACILVLNSYWKLKLIYPVMWRWWAYVREFTEEQMTPIIEEGKKKLPLEARYNNTMYSLDMRTDEMTMTKKQGERYRAELLSGVQLLSSKTSPSTEGQEGSSSASIPSLDGATIGSLHSLR